MPEDRRLAAIMFTDIVGYTALMGSDEDQAFQILRKNREIQRPIIKKYRGEWLKDMGDGILASFNSSSDAVRCAGEIQQAVRIEGIAIRIGIHEGEVVFDEGDVLGDGVNVASRLEDSCEPGNILISEAVYNNLRNKPDIRAGFIGEVTLKNVDHPIGLYRIHAVKFPEKDQVWEPDEESPFTEEKTSPSQVSGDGPDSKESHDQDLRTTEKGSQREKFPKKQAKKGISIVLFGIIISFIAYFFFFKNDKFESIKEEDGRISIAVMPYRNLSGDTLYDWWQMGLQNILITELSTSTELAVRQNQTMNLAVESKKNKNQASITPTIAEEIASQLNVKAFAMGSILKAGERIRLTTQLYETETGEIFKTFELDGKSEDDFFIMTDSLSASIKNFLEIRKLAEKFDNPDIQRSAINTESPEAFKHYLFGYEAFNNVEMSQAIVSYLKAIEIDPAYINAYIDLILSYGISGNDEKGRVYLDLANELKKGLPLKEQLALEYLNAYLNGNPDQEITYLKQILRIDEMNTTYWLALGRAHQKLKQYSAAISCWEKMLNIYDQWGLECPYPWIHFWLGDAYHHLGEHQTENNIYRQGLQQDPDNIINFLILRDQAICALSRKSDTGYDYLKNTMDTARSNGRSESDIALIAGYIYEKAGLQDSAEYYYRKALEAQPDDPEKMIRLARFLIDHDRGLQEGIALNEKALAIQPQNWYGLETRGWGLYKMGDYEEALKVLKEAWPHRPSSSEPTFAYLHIQEVDKALVNQ